MPFYAFEDIDHTQKIEWNEVITPKQRNADYYCPGCNCIFRYRGAASNGRRPHFYRYSGEHAPTCWLRANDLSESGDLEAYNLEGYSTEKLLDAIENSKEKPQKKSGKGKKYTGAELHRIKPSTIRQLYRICCENSDDTVLPDGMSIRDIFCGRKTEYFYTIFCSGIKLVEARYNGFKNDYKAGKRTLFFKYPYRKEAKAEPNIWIIIDVPDIPTFNFLVNSLKREENPVLILAKWSHSGGKSSWTKLENAKQIVPLKG